MADGGEDLKSEKNNYPDFPNPRKTFIPIENNPETFAHLSSALGLSHALSFEDVYTLSEPSLLSHIPRPVHALLFICPASVYFACRASEPRLASEYTGCGPTEPVVWYKQTIRHACGLMGLLHAVSNGGGRQFVLPGSEMETLICAAEPLRWRQRADLLYRSGLLERAHMSAAVIGDTVAPDAADDNGYHYICFTRGQDGRLWELEGGWDGPIERGVLGEGEDMLSENALNLGIRKMISMADGNMEFSLVAMTGGDN